jgi:hypothetical protein
MRSDQINFARRFSTFGDHLQGCIREQFAKDEIQLAQFVYMPGLRLAGEKDARLEAIWVSIWAGRNNARLDIRRLACNLTKSGVNSVRRRARH